ncbi:MAG TPA: polyprenyl synthetase family protein [Polyangiaceae bacterium]|nr:polyprenyl synthetase family protein [Polyangiaceae bacterium]
MQPLLLEVLPSREPTKYLYGPVRQLLASQGKGLRPALCIATCKAFGGDERATLPTAAALELLHNALLVHDDIEDESDYRRGQPTIHRALGVPLAINIGDAMNALVLGLLLQNGERVGPSVSWQIVEEFNHLLIESLEGQAMELGWIRDNDCNVSEQDYLVMVLKKTCWYSFIHPCRLGALIAGERDLGRFHRFAFLTGAAFQIQDDILNLVGQGRTYGKEIGGDLWEGKRTLILTHALGQAGGGDRKRFEGILKKPRTGRLQREVDWMMGVLQETGSIDNARRAAQELATAARSEFDVAYASAPENADKDFLRKLADYVVRRSM